MTANILQPEPDDVQTVAALTRRIKTRLESEFGRVWVEGEVSNLRRQSSGHVYFTLKDDRSQLPCALFARDAAAQTFRLENGMSVLLFGDVSVYEPHGRYQLIVKVAVRGGLGRLHLEYERLKKKLAAEGLFDSARKRPLPSFPRRVAVVTSPSGAAVRDFIRILRRRMFVGEILILPARVQGTGAAEEIARMLAQADRSDPAFDLVVLTRGGGSIEDLWAFNEEPLARAVADATVPVVSAVGHEIDTVLTDLAADARAETPSGAAELISSLQLDATDRFHAAARALTERFHAHTKNQNHELRELRARLLLLAPARRIAHLGMRVDERENALVQAFRERLRDGERALAHAAGRLARQHPGERIRGARLSLAACGRRLRRAVAVERARRTKELAHARQRLDNGSLNASLKRGYAILTAPDGAILDRAALARRHPSLNARMHDGVLRLRHDKKRLDQT